MGTKSRLTRDRKRLLQPKLVVDGKLVQQDLREFVKKMPGVGRAQHRAQDRNLLKLIKRDRIESLRKEREAKP